MVNPNQHAIIRHKRHDIKKKQNKVLDEPLKGIPVHYYPQDPLVSQLSYASIPASFVQDGKLSSPRDIVKDAIPVAQPDEKGEMKFSPTDGRFEQIEILLGASRALSMWENYSGHRINYAFGENKLTAIPHKGEDFNAYYAREEKAINFFYKKDDRLGKVIQSGQSYEIVAHEKGHATLDGWKPRLYFAWAPDAGGFHESFGDISGMLLSLKNNQIINKVLLQTGGNIRKSNVLTRMGEELSRGIADVVLKLPPLEAEKYIMRDAVNKLVWSDPKTLPANPKDPDQLGKEVHNYSRLFTASVWDVFCGIYEGYKSKGMEQRPAIVKTRDEIGKLVAKMIDFGPDDISAYSQLGKAMLVADARSFNGKNKETIADVMLKRKILTEDDVKKAGDEMNKIPNFQLSLEYEKIEGESDEALYAADRILGEHADKLGLSGTELPTAVKVVKNKEGETFYHYRWSSEDQLVGTQYKQYNGAYFDVNGSVVLAFDAERNLINIDKSPITKELVDNAKSHIKYLINEGLVKFLKPVQVVSTHDLFKSDGHPYAAYTTYHNNGTKMKLVPVLIST